MTSALPLIILLVAGIIVGTFAGFFAWDFIKLWVVSILSAAAVSVVVLMLLGVANVENKYVKIVAILVAILAGGYLGKQLNKPIKTFGTAFIGSFLVVRGVSFFLDNWPGDNVDVVYHKYDKAIIGYLLAFVVLFFAGALIQLRMIRDEDVEDDDDDFKGEDDGRTCGCF